MGVVARFGAAGLTTSSVLTTNAFGAGDTPITVDQSGTPTISATGVKSPRLKMDQVASAHGCVYWTPTQLRNITFTNACVRAYYEISAYASASYQLFSTLNGASANWHIDIAGSAGIAGELRIRDGSNTQYGSTGGDGNVLALNTEYRIEVVVTAAGALTVYVYSGNSTTPLFSKAVTGMPAPTFTTLRFGNPANTPTVPTSYFDSLAVSNTAALIGPATGLRVGKWNGTYEEPVEAKVWNGSAEVAASFSSVV